MSYTKYRTEGIILGGSNTGEADRIYNIFTREFGLLRIKAQGIRKLESKLKFHLQNLYLVDLYLISGKGGWRVAEAYKIKSLTNIFEKDKNKLQSSTRILLFLKRMLFDENSQLDIFETVTDGLYFMETESDLDREDVSSVEALIILRVLRNLGYIKDNHNFKNLLSNNDYNKNTLLVTKNSKPLIIKEINQSIRASHL
jgi:DNA repair protein RecO